MSELLQGQARDLVERYQDLCKDMQEQLKGVGGARDRFLVERLSREICGHNESVGKILQNMRPRAEIGDKVVVATFEFDDRGDDFIKVGRPGTIVGIGDDRIASLLAEQIVKEHTVQAFWDGVSGEWVDVECPPQFHS